MIYLVYSSRATRHFTDEDLLTLLAKSRINNEANGLTGILLHHNGNFMQLIEGSDAAVKACYDRISHDPRHTGLIQVVEKPLPLRHFQNWSMAFENLDLARQDEIEGFNQFLNRPFSPTELGVDPYDGLFLLLSFKKKALAEGRNGLV